MCCPFQNLAQQQDRESFRKKKRKKDGLKEPFNPSLLQCGVYLKSEEVIAVKHNRRREQWGFFLALLLKDLLVKERRGNELVFTDNVMHILWLDNSDTGDKFESYRDDRNSPYIIIDRVRIDEIITYTSGWRSYKLPQEEADRIERLLKGGDDSDIDSDDERVENEEVAGEDSSDEPHKRVFVSTRSGRSATRL